MKFTSYLLILLHDEKESQIIPIKLHISRTWCKAQTTMGDLLRWSNSTLVRLQATTTFDVILLECHQINNHMYTSHPSHMMIHALITVRGKNIKYELNSQTDHAGSNIIWKKQHITLIIARKNNLKMEMHELRWNDMHSHSELNNAIRHRLSKAQSW